MEIEQIPTKSNSKEMTNPNIQLGAEEVNAIVARLLAHGEDIEGLGTAIKSNADSIYAHDLWLDSLEDEKANMRTTNKFNGLSALAGGIYNNMTRGVPSGNDSSYMIVAGGNGAKIAIGNQTGRLYSLQGSTWVEIRTTEITPVVVKKKDSKSKIGDIIVHRQIPSVPRKGKKYFFRDGVIKIRLNGKFYNGNTDCFVPNILPGIEQSKYEYKVGKDNLGYAGRHRGFRGYSTDMHVQVDVKLHNDGVVYIRVDYGKPCIVKITGEGFFSFNKVKVYEASNLTAQSESKWLSVLKGKVVCNAPIDLKEFFLKGGNNLEVLKGYMHDTMKLNRKVVIRKREHVEIKVPYITGDYKKYKYKKLVDSKGKIRTLTRAGRCLLKACVKYKGHESSIVQEYDYMAKY